MSVYLHYPSTMIALFLLLLTLGRLSAYQPATSSPLNRRQALAAAIAGTTAIGTNSIIPAAWAEENSYEVYKDVTNGFSFKVPTAWKPEEKTLSDRRKINIWTDPSDQGSTSLFVVCTPIRDDFTSLGSFGSVDQVAEQTILPKSTLMDEKSPVQAKMLSAVSKQQAYLFDYTQSVGTYQPTTHFRTIFTLQQGATGGAGAVLVTITAQTPEARYPAVQRTLDTIIDSFGKNTS